MGKIIAVANQKGGVGKTTTSINLSACLALFGKPTLLVDIDPQGNATSGLGINKNLINGKSIYEVMLKHIHLDDIIQPSPLVNLRIAPSTKKLVGAEIELIDESDRDFILKHALQRIDSQYDYLIIDCPPSLNLLTVNALGCANSVIVPMQCEYYAMEGISDLLESIDRVRSSLNPSLELEGVLLTMFDIRTNISEQVSQEVRAYFKNLVFESIIPRNVKLCEAPSYGLPIILYDNQCKGATAYSALAQEIISRET